jgi:hypothetical protein
MRSYPFSPIPTSGFSQLRWALHPLPRGSRSIRSRIRKILNSKSITFKSNITNPENGDFPKIDTSPFISANLWRTISSIVIDRSTNIFDLQIILRKFHGVPINIFCHTSRFSELISTLKQNNVSTEKWIFFIGRGNNYFCSNDFLNLEIKYKKIYVQHLLGESISHKNIFPLPTGIATQLVSEDLVKFLKQQNSVLGIKNNLNRNCEILLNFDISNNIRARKDCYQTLKRHKNSLRTSSMNFYDFFSLVQKSMFVASPPGAGPDCYRTWETIYAGAVPIVLKSAFPSYENRLPVWVVDSWDDVLKFKDDELKSKFLLIKNNANSYGLSTEIDHY